MLIADVALIDGIATNGVVVNAYRAARFSGIPALNAAPPGGAPDAGPVTSGTIFGGVGNFEITTPTAEAYYLSAVFGGQTAWQLYPSMGAIAHGSHAARPAAGNVGNFYYETDTDIIFYDNGAVWVAVAGGVASLTAGDASITVGGGPTTPTVAVNLGHANTWSAAQTLPLVDAGGQSYNVKAYGAYGDLYVAPNTGQMTAGSNALTLSSGSFPSLSTSTMALGNPVYVGGAQDQIFSDCVFNGTATIVSASAMFQAYHLGRTVSSTLVTVPGGTTIVGILNAGNGAILSAAVTGSGTGNLSIRGTGVLSGFIGAGSSTSQINLVTTSGGVTALNAVRSVSAAPVQVGHDDTVAIQAAITAAMQAIPDDVTPGGEVLIPAGSYGVSTIQCWISGVQFNAGTLVIQGAGIDNTKLISLASLMASSGTGNFGHILVPYPPTTTPTVVTTVPRVAFRDLTFDDGYWAASASPAGPPFATATIAAGSDGVALSSASVINVSTTTEFTASGRLDVKTSTGTFSVQYGSKTATSFGTLTVNAGVTGTMAAGQAVSGDTASSIGGFAARVVPGGMFGTSLASGNTVIINLPYPYQGLGDRWATQSGTTTLGATKTTITLPGSPLSSLTDYIDVLHGALIAVDTNLAAAGPPAHSAAWALIDGVHNDGTNDVVSLESSFWMDTFYPGAYQYNGGVPVGSAGTITWTLLVQNFRGTLHEFRRVRFFRPRGFVCQPTKCDFQQCVFDQCGQPHFSEVVHEDILGSGGTTAVVNDCDFIGGHGNFVDFQGSQAAFPCIQFSNNRAFGSSGYCNIAGLGMGSIITGNRMYNLSDNGWIGYDQAMPQSCNGWNVVANNAGNMFVNLTPNSAQSAFGSRVSGNIAPDSPFGPWVSGAPAVPASGTAYVPTKACDFTVYLAWTGTGTCAIALTPPNGAPTTLRTLAAGNVTTMNFQFHLPAGGTAVTLTYSGGTPTWQLVGH